MDLKTKLIFSGIVSILSLIFSIFFNLIPCKIAPLVPPYFYKWTLCNLDPSLVNSNQKLLFFGYASSLSYAYLTLISVTFILAFLLIHFINKNKKE